MLACNCLDFHIEFGTFCPPQNDYNSYFVDREYCCMDHLVQGRPCLPVPWLTTPSVPSSEYLAPSWYRSSSERDPGWCESSSSWPGKFALLTFWFSHRQCRLLIGNLCLQNFKIICQLFHISITLYIYFREHAPSIIFMDEIDSIGSTRLEAGSGGKSFVKYVAVGEPSLFEFVGVVDLEVMYIALTNSYLFLF